MPAEWIHTVGNKEQIDTLFKGIFMKGRREPRIAMVGRSNVGKSTLINALTRVRLAQVSNSPGKTSAIHFYAWPEMSKILVDLPGYGYAKKTHSERDRWAEFINAYLTQETNLRAAWVLLDSRHGPTDLDAEAIQFLSLSGIPVTFIMTKADQLKTQSERAKRKREVAERIGELGYDPSRVIWVSSETRDGLNLLEMELKSP